MNKQYTENKISAIVLILISITIAAAVGNIMIMGRTIDHSKKIDALEKKRAYCETTILELMNGSDYLTNEIWSYAVDENPQHMKNYWNEVCVTRSRDKALQKLLHEDITNQERVHAMRAKSYSDNLIAGETVCMRFIAESCGMKETDMSPQVRDCHLNEQEEQFSAEKKKEIAQSYLLGIEYSTAKQNIRLMVQSFQKDISVRMNNEVHDSLESNKTARLYGIVFSILLMSMMIAGTILYAIILRRKNAQLSSALEKAEAASSAKTYFTARMSHEIRTPLNAVLGYLTIAKTESNVEKRNSYFAKCEIAARNLLNIVNDVLDLSAIENRRMKLAEVPFSIKTLLKTLEVVYSKQAEKKNITLVFSTAGICCDNVCGDMQRTTQILTNLLSNAIKFTPNGGHVNVTAIQEKNTDDGIAITTEYTVQDDGIGMSSDFLLRIFEPYEQADASINQKYGGTGLGLSIVKNMAEMMGGSVSVSSELGKGSTFTVCLPTKKVTAPAVSDLPVETEAESKGDFNGVRVLLAEDNEMNSEIAVNLLTNLGITVTAVKDGLECAETFVHSEPGTYDLILMDVMMPRLNGYEATKRIRGSAHQQAACIPIIAMTANAFSSDIQQALDSGMNAHIAKPFDAEELIRTIRKYTVHA